MLIDSEMFCEGIDLIEIFQEMNVITECLLISWKIFEIPVVYELLPIRS